MKPHGLFGALMLGAVAAAGTGAAAAADGATPGPDAVTAWCHELGERLRSVSAETCPRQGFEAATARSIGGRPLMTLDRPPAPPHRSASLRDAGRAPRVMMIGGIHGDELTSVSIVFRWIERMGSTAAAGMHWRIVPVANPDGLLMAPSRRTNARGVDLNRNFDTPDWPRDAMAYWVARTRRDPRRYPGEAPESEPETRWLQQQIAEFRPDVIVSVHAPYGVLDFDGPAEEPKRFGRLRLNRLGVYPGSLGNYGGLHKGVPVITIELPHASRMPPDGEQEAIWRDMLKWIGDNIVPANLS